MRKYENHVQKFKNLVMKEVSKYAFEGTLNQHIHEIPKNVSPGPDAHFRCCVYHERAVVADRVQMALGGNTEVKGMVEVLPSACDQCTINRYVITETCRGCIANRCMSHCPVDAIYMHKGKAVINYDKCIECGRCKEACPYNAIADVMRPCKRDCPTNAITFDDRKLAIIDYDKCISCGACVYNCPFGAIQDKSQVVSVIEMLRMKQKPVYAMLAPAFATQFEYVDLGKVITGIKKLGFRDVIEVALGADMVTRHEAHELLEHKEKNEVLTSSCCPGFVNYIDLKYPELKHHVSKTVSPMTATARLIKAIDPEGVVVFIGPCIAKKTEQMRAQDTDYVLTFEELAAMLDSQNLDLAELEPSPLNNASYFGRKFATSGGVSASVANYLKEISDVPIDIEACDGIDACDKALKLLKFNRFNKDFIEGMACKGGCIKGPVTMHYGPKDIKVLESYSKAALESTPDDALDVFKTYCIPLE